MHAVYKYYTNMPVNGKWVYLEPFVMSTTQKVVLAVFCFSGVSRGVDNFLEVGGLSLYRAVGSNL